MKSPVADIANRPERNAIMALLESADLPTADLAELHLEHFFFMGPRTAPFGVIGLEIHGRVALLRSLVVAPDHRIAGIGTALVKHAEDYAGSRGIESAYLLTTTAEQFFARRGYCRIERNDAPDSIRSTREFSGICPETSAFMVKHL